MKKVLFFVAAFSLGFFANDVSDIFGIEFISNIHADVDGMGYRELRRDRDFRRAVESIVEGCSVSGYVDDDYLYGTSVSC